MIKINIRSHHSQTSISTSANMDSFSSQDTDFLLASRRAFTPESSPIPTSRPVSPISLSFAANGAVVVDLEFDDEELLSVIPEDPPNRNQYLSHLLPSSATIPQPIERD